MQRATLIRKFEPLNTNQFERPRYLPKDVADSTIFLAPYEPADVIGDYLQRLNRHISPTPKRALPDECAPFSFTFLETGIRGNFHGVRIRSSGLRAFVYFGVDHNISRYTDHTVIGKMYLKDSGFEAFDSPRDLVCPALAT